MLYDVEIINCYISQRTVAVTLQDVWSLGFFFFKKRSIYFKLHVFLCISKLKMSGFYCCNASPIICLFLSFPVSPCCSFVLISKIFNINHASISIHIPVNLSSEYNTGATRIGKDYSLSPLSSFSPPASLLILVVFLRNPS